MPLDPAVKARMEAQLKKLLAETTDKSHDTKTSRERKQEFEKRFGFKTPTADLVARIEAAERIIWIPHCYVLFARQNTCRNCRATERGMDTPQLFLQKRRERRDDSNPYLYEPCKAIEFHRLPRRTILRVTTSPFCLTCFDSQGVITQVAEKEEHEASNPSAPRGSEEIALQHVMGNTIVNALNTLLPQDQHVTTELNFAGEYNSQENKL